MHTMHDLLKMPCDLALGEKLLPHLDQQAVEDAALYGDDMDEQTFYANQNIRDQLVLKGLVDQAVAEWTLREYDLNFSSLDADRQGSYRTLYIQNHQAEPVPNNLEMAL